MAIKVEITDDKMRAKIRTAKLVVQNSMSTIFEEFIKNTPRDKGNARDHTYVNGKTIHANYEYAQVLEAGRGVRDGKMRGSEQAPKGMTQPTLKFAKDLLKRKMNLEGNK
jgi:hypothetical protein